MSRPREACSIPGGTWVADHRNGNSFHNLYVCGDYVGCVVRMGQRSPGVPARWVGYPESLTLTPLFPASRRASMRAVERFVAFTIASRPHRERAWRVLGTMPSRVVSRADHARGVLHGHLPRIDLLQLALRGA